MHTLTLDHDQYMESIKTISDEKTHRFSLQAESWWNRHFNWKKDGCRVLSDEEGNHLAYLFYKVDRYRDYLTLHNIFTPKIHRDNGYALGMLKALFLTQADRGVRRFRMNCTSGALGFYENLSLIYWGVDTIGNYYCDLPLPETGVDGIFDMVATDSNRLLLGMQSSAIYDKVKKNGTGFEDAQQQRFDRDKKKLGGAYRHRIIKNICEK